MRPRSFADPSRSHALETASTSTLDQRAAHDRAQPPAVAAALGGAGIGVRFFRRAWRLWAFEFGKDIAGLDRGAKEELAQLRAEVQRLRDERERGQSIANTADSLLKAERATQEKLTQQLRAGRGRVLALKADLGFFERLLPAGTATGLAVRSLQAEVAATGPAALSSCW